MITVPPNAELDVQIRLICVLDNEILMPPAAITTALNFFFKCSKQNYNHEMEEDAVDYLAE